MSHIDVLNKAIIKSNISRREFVDVLAKEFHMTNFLGNKVRTNILISASNHNKSLVEVRKHLSRLEDDINLKQQHSDIKKAWHSFKKIESSYDDLIEELDPTEKNGNMKDISEALFDAIKEELDIIKKMNDITDTINEEFETRLETEQEADTDDKKHLKGISANLNKYKEEYNDRIKELEDQEEKLKKYKIWKIKLKDEIKRLSKIISINEKSISQIDSKIAQQRKDIVRKDQNYLERANAYIQELEAKKNALENEIQHSKNKIEDYEEKKNKLEPLTTILEGNIAHNTNSNKDYKKQLEEWIESGKEAKARIEKREESPHPLDKHLFTFENSFDSLSKELKKASGF